MLTRIRDRATGWIAWFIVILISIPFALWGVNEYFAGGENINVAVVNGSEIDQEIYRQALEERRNSLRRMLGSNFDPDVVNSAEFKQGVLDDLIARNLLSLDADDQGYRVGDVQLRDFIRNMPQFQADGQFDKEAYARAVASYGYTKTGFEAQLRQQNVVQQLRDGFQRSAFVTEADEQQLVDLAAQTRTFEYVELKPELFLEEIAVSDDEVQTEYESNSERYTEPERIKVQYVRLSVEDLRADSEPEDADLRKLYEDNLSRYTVPEERRASHILITLDSDSDEATEEQALAKARELADKAQSGEDFAELAKAHSQDPGSANNGGDLGVIAPGVMVPPFEQAVLGLSVDEVSDPVKTRFGYHVIKLTGLKAEQIKPFEEVKGELEDEERQRQAEAIFLDRAEVFRNLVFEQPETLEPVALELGLELQASDWFSREQGSGLAANPRIRDAAFSDDVYIDNLNSETIEVDANTFVALRKSELQAAQLKPLAEVRSQIEEKLKREKAQAEAVETGGKWLQALESGSDWKTVTGELPLSTETITLARLDGAPDLGEQVLQAVFRKPQPEPGGGARFGGVASDDGSYVLFRLIGGETRVAESEKVEVTESDGAEVAESDEQEAEVAEVKQRVGFALERRRGQDYFLSYQKGLREQADIQVFEEHL